MSEPADPRDDDRPRDDHCSDDRLADYDAGLLDPVAVGRVDAHLPTCPDCTERLDAIRRVSALLAAEPAPAMPADVFARLHHSVTALVDDDQGNADYPDDPEQRPRVESDAASGYADRPPASSRPVGQRELDDQGVDRVSTEQPSKASLPASIAPQAGSNPGWSRPTMGSLEKTMSRRRRPSRIIFAALGTCALAAVVGFAGYLVSAVSGHNEPAADRPLVLQDGQLGDSAEVGDHADLSAHRFSDAWTCARRVTSGRITGIRASVVDDRSGFLVFLAGTGGTTRVVFVSGCGASPTAGPSSVLPDR